MDRGHAQARVAVGLNNHEPVEQLGLRVGEKVRFRRTGRARWQDGTVTRREKDGSLGIADGKGAACAIPLHRVEVRCAGPRGGQGWEPLLDRAARVEQMRLL